MSVKFTESQLFIEDDVIYVLCFDGLEIYNRILLIEPPISNWKYVALARDLNIILTYSYKKGGKAINVACETHFRF